MYLDEIEDDLETTLIKRVIVQDLKGLKDDIDNLQKLPTLQDYQIEDLDSDVKIYNGLIAVLDWYFTRVEKERILEELKDN
jgi:hypothetical protein